jgi:transposase
VRYVPAEISLTDDERVELEHWTRCPTQEHRAVERARVVLLASEGLSNAEISRRLGIAQMRVGRWRRRFAEGRIEGLQDRKHTGRPPRYGHDEQLRIVTAAIRPPKGKTRTLRGLTEHLEPTVGIRKSQLHAILKNFDLKPHQEQQWLNSADPDFEAKQADIVGLYLDPPENALVISVDEKTQMVVREPTKPMRQGTPARREFEYIRHGCSRSTLHSWSTKGRCWGE